MMQMNPTRLPFKLSTAAATLALFAGLGNAGMIDASPATGASLIGIDHLPTVVADLEQASDSYRRLGFSLKPGRAHQDGLRNAHVKFPDGSGIELISVPAEAGDSLTRSYAALLREGEGPAYLSFHARDTKALTAALDAAGIGFENEGGLVKPVDPQLDFIFFVRDNRSPTDKPEHFAHPNGATAMPEVWLALDGRAQASLRKLLRALGAVESSDTVEAPTRMPARVFQLQNGRIILVSQDHQLVAGREIIGAKFRVEPMKPTQGRERSTDLLVTPANAHGLWLRFGSRP